MLAPVALVTPLKTAVMGLVQATFQPKIPLISGALNSGLLIALTNQPAGGWVCARLCPWLRRSQWRWGRRHRPGTCGRDGWASCAPRQNDLWVASVHDLWSGRAGQHDVLGGRLPARCVFLGGFHGRAAAGAYAPISGIADAIGALFAILASYALPAMTAARVRGKNADLLDLTRWTSRWGLALCAPALALMAAAPGPLAHLLFGSRFAGMVLPARILALGVTIDVLLGFNTFAILALGLPRVLVRNALLGLVVSVIACATLIPRLGAVGAAVATAIAILAVNGLASSFLWHRAEVPPMGWPAPSDSSGIRRRDRGGHSSVSPGGQRPWPAGDCRDFGGIPTLAVSVLAGGAADRELLAALLNTVHRKVQLGFRKPDGSQEVAQWPVAPERAGSTIQQQRPHRPRHCRPRTPVRLVHRRSLLLSLGPRHIRRRMRPWISSGRHSLRHSRDFEHD